MDAAFEPGEKDFARGLRALQRGWRTLLGEPAGEQQDVYRIAAGVGRDPAPPPERSTGAQDVDRGLELLERGVAAMTAALPDITQHAEAYRCELAAAAKMHGAMEALAARYAAGVPLVQEEVEYEVGLYDAVWTTHPYLRAQQADA